MIAVRLMGGLGNQMFQYAFGRQMAVRMGVPLQLDLRWFENIRPTDTPRVYELGRYPIQATIAPPKTLPYMPTTPLGCVIWPRLRRLSWGMRVFERYAPGFAPEAAIRRDRTLFVGYWQSERYFPDVGPELRTELSLPGSPEGRNAEYAAMIQDGIALSLHVRRGDYVSSAHTNAVHGLAPLDYYREAVRQLRERVPEGRFFVFSDDIAWCRDGLSLDANTVFVQGNDGPNAGEDMRLMSLCRHHIIANSSFSWWGAWLNPSPEKIVFAPRRWFADPKMDTTDLIPPSWIQL